MSTNLPDVARVLLDYDVGAEVGRGEFGIVWSARHRQLRREVAIKQLAGPATSTAEYSARFRREARILAQMDHPHVVTVYDYREEGELRLLVMELLPGGTFADRRAAGITIETAIASTLAAASGLHHVHEQGILHRDVKPENLMFDTRGVLKVTDFGIARGDLVDTTAINVTHAGEFFGTPAYVAPEQAGHALGEGWPPIDAAADQYSLAAVLYEALSGRLTHDTAGGAIALCHRRMNEEARPLSAVAPAVPAEIEAVVMKALARDPSRRYPTTEDFAVALGTAATKTLAAGWLARSAVQIRDAGPIRDSALGPREQERAPDAQPHAKPRRTGLVISVFAVVLIAALASFLVLTRRDSPSAGVGNSAPATGLRQPRLQLAKQWAVATGGDVLSSPAVSGEFAVVGSGDGSVYAIGLQSGKTLWKRPTGGPVRSSPTIANGRVFVGSNDGNLYALDLVSGSVVWKAPIGFEIVSSPAVAGGVVVVGSNRLYAFDAATGAARWTFNPGAAIVSSPAIAGDTVVVGSNDHAVYGIALSNGEQRWHFRTGDAVQSSPAVASGVAYVGGIDGYVYAIDVATGKSPWATDLASPVKSSPVVSGGRVFVGTDAGDLVALDAATGTVRWTFNTSDRVDSSPAVVGDLVVVGSDDDTVYAVSASSGALEGKFKTGGPVLSSPQVIGTDVVVGSHDHQVYKIGGFDTGGG
jgi:outer membrane protein assembly factor BamB